VANTEQLVFPLLRTHDTENFNSGRPSLDIWIRDRAFQAERSKSARTYVMCLGDRVIAYYSLAAAERVTNQLSRLTKGMPRHPIPLIMLARLAVDKEFQGRGYGSLLLSDALARSLAVSKMIGARAVIVEPIDDAADKFYARFGFEKWPAGAKGKEKTENQIDPRFILIKDIEKYFTSSGYSS